METNDMLKKLLEAGETMREYQKSYFRETTMAKKSQLLIKSKQAEKEFDNAIFNIKQLLK